MKRKPVKKIRKDKKIFTKTAVKTHVKNVAPPPMRGGVRL